MPVNDEQRCYEICSELTEMDGTVIEVILQVGGRIEITGVWRRFFGWQDAREYLDEMLEASRYVRSLQLRSPHARYGNAPPKKARGSKKRT